MHARLLELTNMARQQAGAAPLHTDTILQRAAHAHALAMASSAYFDHIDRLGRGVGGRLIDAGYNYRWCGENISAGKDNVDAVFHWWMSSPAHRENILKPEFTAMGLGHTYVRNDRLAFHHYWVQVFASPL